MPRLQLMRPKLHIAVSYIYTSLFLSCSFITAAGVETSTSTLLSFILAMVLHLSVQEKAQNEIDSVLHGRLPTIEDRDNNRLPYVNAVLTETYRWAPPGPFGEFFQPSIVCFPLMFIRKGLPHYLTTDDEVDGYSLPKGTIVISNIWSVTF